MSDDQHQVIQEQRDLNDKIGALTTFIRTSDTFFSLDVAEQNRLRNQLMVMELYSAILDERIGYFN